MGPGTTEQKRRAFSTWYTGGKHEANSAQTRLWFMGLYLEVFHLLHDALAQVLLLCNFLLQLRAGASERR
jgi:hypothetical protein